MRYTFAKILKKIALKDKKVIFITGDLGFNAFEDLRDSLQNRFINAGIAEHNMVTMASGLAYAGFKPYIYSIAPFATIKVLEEIRNDICFPKANVKIVGLGGGFDYGVAGPSHHALEDVGILSTLPNMKIYAPSFVEDLPIMLRYMHAEKGPSYIRLTKAQKTEIPVPPYKTSARRINKGNKITAVVLGSMSTTALKALSLLGKKRNMIDMWVISELPLTIPSLLRLSLKTTKKLCVIEEHVKTGGLGQQMLHELMKCGINIRTFTHLCATGYISGLYGDRQFYLTENGLDEVSIANAFRKLI